MKISTSIGNIAFGIAFCLLITVTPAKSQSVWAGALQGLARSIEESADREIEQRNRLELERRRYEMYEAQEQRRLEREAAMRQEQRARQEIAERAIKVAQEKEERARAEESRKNGVTGSGFFFSDRGHLVTNAHVIDDYKYVAIKDSTGKIFEARILKLDKDADLAALVVDRPSAGLKIATSTADLKGEDVYVIGYPMPGVQGQESKITSGVVSALSGLQGLESWMQISAPIQGGNSGGPLVTPGGVVVGAVVASINAKKLLERSGSIAQNVNYAIKSEAILQFLASLGVGNGVRQLKGKPLRAVDESTVMILARDAPFTGNIVPKPDALGAMTRSEREAHDYSLITSDSPTATLRQFVKDYPESKRVGKVNSLLALAETTNWKKATDSASLQKLQEFLVDFPKSKYAKQANFEIDRIEELSRLAKIKENSARTEDAARLLELEAQIWEETKNEGTAAAYDRYLAKYPNGNHAYAADWNKKKLQSTATRAQPPARVDSISSASISEGEKIVEASHPGWKSLVRQEAFKVWMSQQPKPMSEWAKSNDPRDAIALLDLYKKSRR